MKFSKFGSRLSSDSGILQLMNDLGSAVNTAPGEELYMLGGGNPSHIPEVQSILQEELRAVVEDKINFNNLVGNYDGPQGNETFIKSLTEMFRGEYGWDIDESHIAITNGSQSSFGLIFNFLAGEFPDGSNKTIMLPLVPEYIGYGDVGLTDAPLFSAVKPLIDIGEDGFYKYRVDFDNLELNDAIGAVCVSRPTNPTGNVITDEEVEKLARLTKAAGVPMIIDGAYGLPFPNIIFNQATPYWDENVILCLSLSKLGLPGVRTGIVIANPALIQKLTGANAIFSLAPGSLGPKMINRLVQNRKLLDISNHQIRPYYQKQVQIAVEAVQENMQGLPVYIHQPEGAIFLWLWFKGLPIDSDELYRHLKEQNVLIIAGQHFFPGIKDKDWPHQYECIRVSYVANKNTLRTGIRKIGEAVRAAFSKVEA